MQHEEIKKNYYAIIPADIRYDENLKDKAKLLYGEITALCNEKGYCYASNKYFADLYGVSTTTISLLIKNLIENGYIESEIIYKENSKEIIGRYLRISSGGYLSKVKEGYLSKVKEGYLSKVKDNNTDINNTYINKKNYNKKENSLEKFEAFYKEYPKKVSKENVRKWFIKNNPSDELFKIIMNSLKKFKQLDNWKKDNGKFIPYPSTWLNQKRWEDEIETDEDIINKIFDGLED